jgi:hypothetical protein
VSEVCIRDNFCLILQLHLKLSGLKNAVIDPAAFGLRCGVDQLD